MQICPALLILCLLKASWLWAKEPVAPPIAPPVYLHPELLRFDLTRAQRTYQDVQRSKQEETDTVFLFADSLGCDFNETNLPKTAGRTHAQSEVRLPGTVSSRPSCGPVHDSEPLLTAA